MIILKIIAAFIILISVLVIIIYRMSVLISKKYDRKERLSALIELVLISCFLILLVG